MAANARPFGELFAAGTRNGLTRPKAVRGAGVKMVNMGELFAHPRLRNASMDRVSLSEAEADRFLLEPGDLLFARQSLVLEGAGKCSIFLEDDELVTFESHITRVRLDPQKADPRFYFYYLQSHHGRAAIKSIVEQGAGASGIRGSDLEKLRVLWRPVSEQRAIADSLGALDDKIEQNRQTARALERLARAIFRAWFVDFEPVKAKAVGATAFPSMPQAVFDALPTRFVKSEFGVMPEGWQRSTIGESANHVAMGPFGSDIKTDNFVAEGVPVIRGGNLTDGFVDEGFAYLTEAKADQLANANAFPGDLVITHRGTLGQVGLIPSKSRHRRYVVSQSQMLIRPNAELLPRHFLYLFLTSPAGQHELLANRSQTGVPAISRPTTSVKAIRVVVPAHSILLRHFESIATTLFDGLAVIGNESRKLAQMRDYLLPKLMSGQIRAETADD